MDLDAHQKAEGSVRPGQRIEKIAVLGFGANLDGSISQHNFSLDDAVVEESVLVGGSLDADSHVQAANGEVVHLGKDRNGPYGDKYSSLVCYVHHTDLTLGRRQALTALGNEEVGELSHVDHGLDSHPSLCLVDFEDVVHVDLDLGSLLLVVAVAGANGLPAPACGAKLSFSPLVLPVHDLVRHVLDALHVEGRGGEELHDEPRPGLEPRVKPERDRENKEGDEPSSLLGGKVHQEVVDERHDGAVGRSLSSTGATFKQRS